MVRPVTPSFQKPLPPPIYQDPIEQDSDLGRTKFHPQWLKWFTDLANRVPGPYIVSRFIAGSPTGGQKVLVYLFDRSVAFAPSFEASKAMFLTAPGGDVVITLEAYRVGGSPAVNLGTIEFKLAVQAGTFINIPGAVFYAGDLLVATVTTADGTASDLVLTLVGAQ